MIDQRVLPARFEYLRYDSAAAVAEGIRDHGGARRTGDRLSPPPTAWRSKPCGTASATAAERSRRAMERPSTCWRPAGRRRSISSGRSSACACIWESLAGRTGGGTVADALLAEAHEILAEDIRINRAHGRTRRGAAGRRRARAHPLQCRRAGHGRTRHGAGRDPLGGRGGQAHLRHRRRDAALPAGCASDGLGNGAGEASRSRSSPTTWPAT